MKKTSTVCIMEDQTKFLRLSFPCAWTVVLCWHLAGEQVQKMHVAMEHYCKKGGGGFWLARCWTQLESNRFKCCFNSTHSVFLPPAVERWSSNSLFLSKPKPIYVRQWAVITKLLFSSQNQSPQRTAPPQPLSPATLSLSPRLSYFLFALLLASLSSFHLVFIIYCGAVLL